MDLRKRVRPRKSESYRFYGRAQPDSRPNPVKKCFIIFDKTLIRLSYIFEFAQLLRF